MLADTVAEMAGRENRQEDARDALQKKQAVFAKHEAWLRGKQHDLYQRVSRASHKASDQKPDEAEDEDRTASVYRFGDLGLEKSEEYIERPVYRSLDGLQATGEEQWLDVLDSLSSPATSAAVGLVKAKWLEAATPPLICRQPAFMQPF